MNKYQKAKSKIVKVTMKGLELDNPLGIIYDYRSLKKDLNEFINQRYDDSNMSKFEYVIYQKEICNESYNRELKHFSMF